VLIYSTILATASGGVAPFVSDKKLGSNARKLSGSESVVPCPSFAGDADPDAGLVAGTVAGTVAGPANGESEEAWETSFCCTGAAIELVAQARRTDAAMRATIGEEDNMMNRGFQLDLISYEHECSLGGLDETHDVWRL